MAQTARPEKTEAERLLRVANRFLQQRSFSKCSKYARQAHLSDPANSGPHQILAISTVLSAASGTDTNHYTILGLASPRHDENTIRTHFENLSSILNPTQNPFSLASQAHGLVIKAWSVLSNPSAKTRFDKSFKLDRHGGGSGTFWIMCPYCYYVYEYEDVYVDCCLRCQNVTCRKAYHAVPVKGPPPPQVVVETGRYACNGFFLSGGENRWDPFGPAPSPSSTSSSHVVIEIPDGETDQKDAGSKCETMKVRGEKEKNENVSGGNVEKEEFRGGIEIKEKSEGGDNNDNIPKKGTRKKRMVSRNSTKFLKKKVRVRRVKEETIESDENSVAGVECIDVEDDDDDDIFVGLQDIEK